jgi:lysophospholipase L1-like esterase
LAGASILSTSALRADAPAAKPIVVCFGDSITHAGYPAELEKVLPVRAINSGVSGNTSRQGLARIERDVLAHKPDVVVVLFGTNDMREDAPRVRVSISEYETNLTTIITRCRASGAQVIIGTMPPVDAVPYFTRHVKEKFDAAGGLEKLISHYRASAIRMAASNGVPVVDLNRLLANKGGWRKNDGVHPTPEGNRILAELFAVEVEKLLKPASEKKPARG